MMEAVRTSATPVFFNETTQRCIPEGYHNLYTRRRVNPKSHVYIICLRSLYQKCPEAQFMRTEEGSVENLTEYS
jgi:hypothetical protein